MGVCIKKHFLTCFQQALSGLRSLALCGKHGDGAGSLPPETLHISTYFTFTLKNKWTELTKRVLGALMRDMHSNIIIIFQKQNHESMLSSSNERSETYFPIHVSGSAAYTAKTVYFVNLMWHQFICESLQYILSPVDCF